MPDKLKKGWKIWRFDQMATMVNERVDNPEDAGVEYYVGLEHLDPESLTIRRWGSPSDVAATKLRFRKGDIIFGRRRVYQRKLAVAHFDGICSAHAMVLRARPDIALPDFLPFFMQSDLFMERAKRISVGSLSPTINWKTLAQEEFALPPLDEQRRIAELLSIINFNSEAQLLISQKLLVVRKALQDELLFATPNKTNKPKISLIDIAEINPSNPPLQKSAAFIPMDCVDEWEREIKRFEIRGTRGGIRAAAGDVLMARITPCLENGKIAQVPVDIDLCGGSTEFIVFRARKDTNTSYLYWLISSDRVRNIAIAMMTGSTGRQRVSGKDLEKIRILYIEPAEQIRIGKLIDAIEKYRKQLSMRYQNALNLQRIALLKIFGDSI